MRKHLTLYLMLIATTSYAVVSRAATPADTPFWTGQGDASTFAKLQEDRLTRAKQSLDRMLAVTGKRTIENTLKPYDENVDLPRRGCKPSHPHQGSTP
jgi:hypothetical protein